MSEAVPHSGAESAERGEDFGWRRERGADKEQQMEWSRPCALGQSQSGAGQGHRAGDGPLAQQRDGTAAAPGRDYGDSGAQRRAAGMARERQRAHPAAQHPLAAHRTEGKATPPAVATPTTSHLAPCATPAPLRRPRPSPFSVPACPSPKDPAGRLGAARGAPE